MDKDNILCLVFYGNALINRDAMNETILKRLRLLPIM